MKKQKLINLNEAKRIGRSLHIDWNQVDLEQFRQGLMVDQLPEISDPEKRLIYDGVLQAGKVVLAHMHEFPDYFTRLEKLEAEVDEYQTRRG